MCMVGMYSTYSVHSNVLRLVDCVVVVVSFVVVVATVGASPCVGAAALIWLSLLWLAVGWLVREGDSARGRGDSRRRRGFFRGGDEQARAVFLFACVFIFSTCHRLAGLEHVLLHLFQTLFELGVLWLWLWF